MAETTVPAPREHAAAMQAQEGTRANEQYIEPRVDIFEDADGLTLMADLPGVTKENLDVEVKDEILTIQAHTRRESKGTPVYREFELTNFFRQFKLSERVDAERISAEFKHGVLTLRMPKAEEAKPKQISVQLG